MNYTNRFISFTVLAAVLSSCGFNEDFCIRNGELVAWCDFSGIRETPPVPEERHIIAFPSGMDIPYPTSEKYKNQTLPYQGIPPYLPDPMYTRIPRSPKSLVYGCSLTDLERNATAINTQNITVRSKTFPHTPWSGNAALCNPYVILPSVLHIA